MISHTQKKEIVMGYVRAGVCVAAMFALVGLISISGHAEQKKNNGEDGFKEHCAACHADGGNIIKPDKTLSRADREKNGIRTVNDIVTIMRKPGEGMIPFDTDTLPDKEATDIADYIVKTFN
jgi:cytochrome c6